MSERFVGDLRMTRTEELAAIDTAIAAGKLIRITPAMMQAYFVLTVLERPDIRTASPHKWRDQLRTLLTRQQSAIPHRGQP